jgi:protein CpxP
MNVKTHSLPWLCAVCAAAMVLPAQAYSRERALAQTQTPAAPAAGTWQPPPPEQVTGWLASKLDLSDEQKSQVTPIIAERQRKLAALRADTTLRRGQKLRQMKAVYEDSDARIEALLTDAQKQQYAALKVQLREQFQERMQQRAALPSGN